MLAVQNQIGNNNNHNNMAIVPVPRDIRFASTGATDESCSREGKSLVLLQLGQIQNQWGLMVWKEEG